MPVCSSSGSDVIAPAVQSDTSDQYETLDIDASSYTEYTYINLDTGEVLALDEAAAATSTDWHLGFNRTNVKLNGGASGPGRVEGALGVAQDDFYNGSDEPIANVFLNASGESEEEHLLGSIDVSGLSFSADENVAAIQGSGDVLNETIYDMGWYFYNFSTHTTSLNDETWWLLKSNLGTSYAKFHATAFNYDSLTGLDVTFEFDVQADGTDQFATTATFNAHVDAGGGSDCFDF